MGDQGRWFKLWTSAGSDPDLMDLSLEDFARWCLFGLHLKLHGESGKITLKPPCNALLWKLRLPDFPALVAILQSFPNCTVSVTGDVTNTNVTITVTWRNWRKYQEDSSVERTRAWRDKRRIQRDDKRDAPVTTLEEKRGEEKRGEETPLKVQGGPGGNGLWPEDLGDVKQHLETVQAPVALHDPSYWLRIDTWLKRDGGYAVSYLDELDAYLAHQAAQPTPQQHKEPKRGLRNWLAKALHWSQSREQTEIFKKRYGPKDAYGDRR